MAAPGVEFRVDYRNVVAEISAYFEQESSRRMPTAQRLALLSTLSGAYEDGDSCGTASPASEPRRSVMEAV